jgi:hypothetical protein
MFYSQSLECCVEARGFLGCSADTAAPCLGFTGDCADLLTVFSGVHIDGAPGIPADYVCAAFPTSSARDTFLLGLISYACSLPVAVFILSACLRRACMARRVGCANTARVSCRLLLVCQLRRL